MVAEIREAAPDEWDEAGRVTADAYREFVRDPEWTAYLGMIADVRGRADRTTILVAWEDGRIVGSATLELDGRVEVDDDPALRPGEAHIRMLGVAPDRRGRGIGRALMADCEERARAAGKTFVTLHTTTPMTAAQAMYGALGYERGPDRVVGDDFVLLSFSKQLYGAL
jgi:ribosomal protein S18 acetylase RimI-like enzyme